MARTFVCDVPDAFSAELVGSAKSLGIGVDLDAALACALGLRRRRLHVIVVETDSHGVSPMEGRRVCGVMPTLCPGSATMQPRGHDLMVVPPYTM